MSIHDRQPLAVLVLPMKVGDLHALLSGEQVWEMTVEWDADYEGVVIR